VTSRGSKWGKGVKAKEQNSEKDACHERKTGKQEKEKRAQGGEKRRFSQG